MLGNERYETDPEYAEAYDQESEKLRTVVEAIREDLALREARRPAEAAHSKTADKIQRVMESLQDSLTAALNQPYFGRVDYLVFESGWDDPDEDEGIAEEPGFDETHSPYWKPVEPRESRIARLSKVMYLGVSHIDGHDIYSWTVPAARIWYTNEQGFPAPGGYVSVRTDLKRHLRVRDQRLVDLNDVYRRQLPPAAQPRQVALTEALSLTGDGHLSVIVETIQPHQYEAIANDSDRVLVVQGSAGSGKSEIGLHRIAFLLSPFNDLPNAEKPTPDTTLFMAPSNSFMDYVADLLPALDVRERVRQTTMREWIQDSLSFRMTVEPDIWNDLLKNGKLTRFNERAETFKSSIAMVDAIERHYRRLVAQTGRAFGTPPVLSVDDPGSAGSATLTIEPSQILQACASLASGFGRECRLNSLRDAFIGRVMDLVWETGDYGSRFTGLEGYQIRQQVQTRSVIPWCDAFWPKHDARDAYLAMFADRQQAPPIKGALSEEDISVLCETVAERRASGFQDSDVAAIAYLDHLLNGNIAPRDRHIVVDEAQDVSPIEFKLLSLSSVNNWFTILGDSVQRLTPYRGVRRWGELQWVLGRKNLKVQEARVSYRANKHITRFNNRILRLFDKNINAPVPYGREGNRPEYHIHSIREDMFRSILEELDRIRTLEGMTKARIAILSRDIATMTLFKKFCSEHDRTDTNVIEDGSAESPIVLARIPDVKGLEYDAVIVLGVNSTFANTTFNQKLLYIAATRAKHYLALHWAGTQSPILREIYDGGVRVSDHRGRR